MQDRAPHCRFSAIIRRLSAMENSEYVREKTTGKARSWVQFFQKNADGIRPFRLPRDSEPISYEWNLGAQRPGVVPG